MPLTIPYIAGLLLVGMAACIRGRWWLGAAMLAAGGQAVSEAFGRPDDPAWLTGPWLWGESMAMLAAACLVVWCVARETAGLVPFRRFTLRVAAGATGAAVAGLVWLTAQYETFYWIFVTSRAKFWLAAAIALVIVVAFVPQRASRETWLVLGLAGAHALTAPFRGSQPVFRCASLLLCAWWLLAAPAARLACSAARYWRRRWPAPPRQVHRA